MCSNLSSWVHNRVRKWTILAPPVSSPSPSDIQSEKGPESSPVLLKKQAPSLISIPGSVSHILVTSKQAMGHTDPTGADKGQESTVSTKRYLIPWGILTCRLGVTPELPVSRGKCKGTLIQDQ